MHNKSVCSYTEVFPKSLIYILTDIQTLPCQESFHIAYVPAKTNDERWGLFWKLFSECKKILRQLKAVKFFVLYVIFRLRTTHFSLRSRSLSGVLLPFSAHINSCYVRLNTSIFFLPEVDRVCIRKSTIRVNDRTTFSFVYILSSVVISVVIELLLNDENERDFLSMS